MVYTLVGLCLGCVMVRLFMLLWLIFRVFSLFVDLLWLFVMGGCSVVKTFAYC